MTAGAWQSCRGRPQARQTVALLPGGVQVVGNTAIVRRLWVSQTELEGKVTETKIAVIQVGRNRTAAGRSRRAPRTGYYSRHSRAWGSRPDLVRPRTQISTRVASIRSTRRGTDWSSTPHWREMERCECGTEGGRSPVNLGSWLISQTVDQEIGFADDSPRRKADSNRWSHLRQRC
jgi:hypothetical protein